VLLLPLPTHESEVRGFGAPVQRANPHHHGKKRTARNHESTKLLQSQIEELNDTPAYYAFLFEQLFHTNAKARPQGVTFRLAGALSEEVCPLKK